MPQDQLTPAEIAEVGTAIATAVSQALAPAFERLAAALATPPGPNLVPAPEPMPIIDAWSGGSMPTHETSAPAPTVPAPAAPRSRVELEEENHFLRAIVAHLQGELKRYEGDPE